MAEIRLLDQATVNQIAAGEVIDRPSSVVKELLENAMDAKSTAVTVEIRDGGVSLIRITDNGCGIEKSQIPMAFKRHATSKLRTIDDLLDINSLGFRGEALSSIAAVAQVEMITKPSQTMLGISYEIEDGQEKSMTEIGAPDGTTILVRNLFYHVPARKKFLKSAATEGNYISQLVENMSMLRPDISLRLIINGQNKLYTSGNGRLKDVIYTIYGREISSNLLEVSGECSLFCVTGFIGKPIISRGNRSFENYFINGRYVKSRLISLAIEEAFKPFMMQHRYPFTVLHIKIDPELIDVNVHPSKMEIRFQQENEIYAQLVKAITDTLKGREFIPDIHEEAPRQAPLPKKLPEAFEKRRTEARKELIPPEPVATHSKPSFVYPDTKANDSAVKDISENPFQSETSGMHRRIQTAKPYAAAEIPADNQPDSLPASNKTQENLQGTHPLSAELFSGSDTNTEVKHTDEEKEEAMPSAEGNQKAVQETLFSEPLLSEKARTKHHLIGQLFDTYWLIEYNDKLYIMDQHAAHEKVNYEKMMAAYKNKDRISQLVSPPMIISLTYAEEAVLNQYMEEFEKLGFTIEPYGNKEFAVSEVPADLYGIDARDLFLETLSALQERGTKSASELIASKLASMSCKASIKGGQTISYREADALVDQLLKLDNPYACPHGRPTLITMSRYEIEKKFKRIV